VIYPPLGAVADSAGGLAGARVLSLVFMLGATALVWVAASALAGRRAALPPLAAPTGCGWLSVYARSVAPLAAGATLGLK